MIRTIGRREEEFFGMTSIFGKALSDTAKFLVRRTSASYFDFWTNTFSVMLKYAETNVQEVMEADNNEIEAANENLKNVKL